MTHQVRFQSGIFILVDEQRYQKILIAFKLVGPVDNRGRPAFGNVFIQKYLSQPVFVATSSKWFDRHTIRMSVVGCGILILKTL